MSDDSTPFGQGEPQLFAFATSASPLPEVWIERTGPHRYTVIYNPDVVLTVEVAPPSVPEEKTP